VITLTQDYARLVIDKHQPFADVTESFRTLFQICRLNVLPAAVVVSLQDPYDWRSSLRVAFRFSASRGAMPEIRLALVVAHTVSSIGKDVLDVAQEIGLECKVFTREADAIAWISASRAA
jgi:hypothetical protein